MLSSETSRVRASKLVEPADKAAFAAAFPNQPFALKHQFAGNPLFALDRIVDLVRELPADSIEYNSGKAAIGQDPDKTPWSISTRPKSCAASRPAAPGWCSSASSSIRPIAP